MKKEDEPHAPVQMDPRPGTNTLRFATRGLAIDFLTGAGYGQVEGDADTYEAPGGYRATISEVGGGRVVVDLISDVLDAEFAPGELEDREARAHG